MREILFRGKRTDNGEWVEGAFSPFYCNEFEERKEKPQIIIFSNFEKIDGLWGNVGPETVSQYTGLTDKNGKKIFEGDILEGHFDEDFPENITLVEVIWKEYGFYTKGKSTEAELLDKFDGEIYEVIGNIYDNPELLEGSGK